ncbi:MAG: hypothetical protein HQM10_11450 [Candidatus Riflebacteria bacterium]|nr:hypothetical protein [Candidatus Riflebacteria bacterium]
MEIVNHVVMMDLPGVTIRQDKKRNAVPAKEKVHQVVVFAPDATDLEWQRKA